MKKFVITVNDIQFGDFTSVIFADSKEKAIEEALEFYASEFGTEVEELNVINVKEEN